MTEKGLVDLPQYHWGAETHASHMRNVMERLAREPDPAAMPEQGGTS
jgi:hypothetical protein